MIDDAPRKPSPIRVAMVEDNDAYRRHLAALISGSDGFVCAGTHANAEEALKRLGHETPDVLLLDVELPGLAGDDSIVALKQKHPALEIIILTLHDEPARILKAIESGASGYLTKPVAPAKLLEAIQEVAHGGAPMSSSIARLVLQSFQRRARTASELDTLTPRETQILELLSTGNSSKEIAAALEISARTVGTHLHHIYAKLHVVSRSQAVAKFLRH